MLSASTDPEEHHDRGCFEWDPYLQSFYSSLDTVSFPPDNGLNTL